MEKVDTTEVANAAGMNPQYKLEVTKNTKGYGWVVAVHGNNIEQIKKDVLELEGWAKSQYS